MLCPRPPANCCAPGPTPSLPARPPGCNASDRSGRSPAPRPNPSPCSAGHPTPASSPWPARRFALGRQHQNQTVTVHVSDTTVSIDLPEGDTMTVRRTTDQPVRSIKGQRPRTANREIS